MSVTVVPTKRALESLGHWLVESYRAYPIPIEIHFGCDLRTSRLFGWKPFLGGTVSQQPTGNQRLDPEERLRREQSTTRKLLQQPYPDFSHLSCVLLCTHASTIAQLQASRLVPTVSWPQPMALRTEGTCQRQCVLPGLESMEGHFEGEVCKSACQMRPMYHIQAPSGKKRNFRIWAWRDSILLFGAFERHVGWWVISHACGIILSVPSRPRMFSAASLPSSWRTGFWSRASAAWKDKPKPLKPNQDATPPYSAQKHLFPHVLERDGKSQAKRRRASS